MTTDGSNPLLQGLTDPQRQAVTHGDGPLLVLAAAGSGKTRVITRRIACLIGRGAAPWSILALTFTNKAAGEMRQRVGAILGEGTPQTRGLTVTTFHSLCARLLRRYAVLGAVPGLKPEFSIYDSADQAALVKKVLESLQLSTSNWPPRTVLSAVSHAKNNLMDAAAYASVAGDFTSRTIARVYTAYEKALRAAGAVDFDDLLLLTARVLKDNAQVRTGCQARWRHLLIDEYQDTNRAQFVIAALLAGSADPPGPNICVVGDPDQAIYGWRGADIANILDFETQYPGARVIRLGENFRSTAPILGAADTLIRHNKLRKHKDLFTSRPGGEKVQVILCRDEQHEASLIADWLRALQEPQAGEGGGEGLAWRDMAVFYRTNSLSRVMEDSLRAAAVPYVIARGTAFFQREEVKNALGYLRLIANPADDVSLLRVLNSPTRGIGAATAAQLEVHAANHAEPILAAMRRADLPGISARARGGIARFIELIDGWTGSGTFMGAGITGSLADLVERTLRESGLQQMYKAQAAASQSESDAERLDNLDELVSSARQFELEYDPSADPANQREDEPPPALLAMLRAYLESVALIADADTLDPAQGAVTLMTLHAAKGLEFPAVAMIGLEEGLLPHSRANQSDAELEEERRLCFVGITRAMRHLHITSAKFRTHRGISERTITSRFLGELGAAHIAVSDQADTLADFGRADPNEDAAHAKFPIGATVRHPQFGVGFILSISGGAGARAQIKFRDVGVKTLVLEYARLQRVD